MALTLDECKQVYDAYQNQSGFIYLYAKCLMKYLKDADDSLVLSEMLSVKDAIGLETTVAQTRSFPELERKINWRLYWDYSVGLMTELASHQLEVCCWAKKFAPESVVEWEISFIGKDGERFMTASILFINFRMV